MSEPFDLARVRNWLRDKGLATGPARLHRIGDGHSNLTYAVLTAERTLVLRRPPPPPNPRGANDMLREARVLRALAGTGVPVPGVLAVAEAGEAMDVPCYVMEHLDGVVATEALPRGVNTSTDRRRTAEAFIDVLAELHAVDWRARGLVDFGRPHGFLERQLDRLPHLIAEQDGVLPAPFANIRDQLAASLPESGEPALLHGDFRFGNVMLGRSAPARLVGVLDWELAAIGDPLADLAYTLVTYAVPDEPRHALTALSTVTLAEGFPGRATLAARYARATGRDLTRLPWYEALALFKLAVLYEYNRRRADSGAGDPYYADPALVDGLLNACRRTLGMQGAPSMTGP